MNAMAAFVVFPLAMLASSSTSARTDYAFCMGGGRANLFYSAVFPVVHGPSDAARPKAFNAFIQAKYGITIFSECHSDLTPALANSHKQAMEDSDQKSKFPSKLIETGWVGK